MRRPFSRLWPLTRDIHIESLQLSIFFVRSSSALVLRGSFRNLTRCRYCIPAIEIKKDPATRRACNGASVHLIELFHNQPKIDVIYITDLV
jgi:hypothetical protein